MRWGSFDRVALLQTRGIRGGLLFRGTQHVALFDWHFAFRLALEHRLLLSVSRRDHTAWSSLPDRHSLGPFCLLYCGVLDHSGIHEATSNQRVRIAGGATGVRRLGLGGAILFVVLRLVWMALLIYLSSGAIRVMTGLGDDWTL